MTGQHTLYVLIQVLAPRPVCSCNLNEREKKGGREGRKGRDSVTSQILDCNELLKKFWQA